jgi:hypothetical protein
LKLTVSNWQNYWQYFRVNIKTCRVGNLIIQINTFLTYMGHAVAQLVKARYYKTEGCGFDSRWCHWRFLLTYSFRPHYGSGVGSASDRNECQE